ncbi:YjbQ family protein [Candidatus Bipolaricaulota bacterium]|nr:YjbQ family protein [Candidatus Bipolaricaulota bacterium]
MSLIFDWVKVPVQTGAHEEILDITSQVQEAVQTMGLWGGVVLLFCPHTTAALTVNEAADPDVRADVGAALAKLVPDVPFRHAEGNSPAHVRAAFLGPSLVLSVEEGKLVLGTWQGVYFCEFDGPRRRQVWIYALALTARE